MDARETAFLEWLKRWEAELPHSGSGGRCAGACLRRPPFGGPEQRVPHGRAAGQPPRGGYRPQWGNSSAG